MPMNQVNLLNERYSLNRVVLLTMAHLTRPMQRTAKARFQLEGVLPVVVSQIGVNCADGVYFCWRGVGVGSLSYGKGYSGSR
jgi:hypothetical protein